MDRSVESAIAFMQEAIGETILFIDSYGSIEQANLYFDNRLNSIAWREAEVVDKKRALTDATRIVDTLRYSGTKTDSDQIHEFPRDNNDTPVQVEMATYELALKLLEGYDVDFERNNLNVESQGLEVRTTYNRTFAQEHLAAGIFSFKAWTFLKPYLKSSVSVNLSRVS